MPDIERIRLWANLNFAANAKLYDMIVSTNGLLDTSGWPLSDIRIRIEWPSIDKPVLPRGV